MCIRDRSRTAWVSAFSAFRALFFSWCSAARRARSAAAPADVYKRQVIVRDEPFLIGMAEVILLADPDPLKHFLQFLGGGGKLHPLAHKLALIVLPKIGDKGGKGKMCIRDRYLHDGPGDRVHLFLYFRGRQKAVCP